MRNFRQRWPARQYVARHRSEEVRLGQARVVPGFETKGKVLK
jgi:hypothetical protein